MGRKPFNYLSIAKKEIKLLPCPFCGGYAHVFEIGKFCGYTEHVGCNECTAECSTIEEWNRRDGIRFK